MIKKNSLISRINIYHKLGYPYNVHRTSGNPHYVRPFSVIAADILWTNNALQPSMRNYKNKGPRKKEVPYGSTLI